VSLLVVASSLWAQPALIGEIDGGDGGVLALLVAPMTKGGGGHGRAAYRYTAEPLPVSRDGRFAADLPPGRYRLTPMVDGEKWVTPVEVELPCGEPLRLSAVRFSVRVRDDRGAAVPGAAVRFARADQAPSAGQLVEAAADGIARAWATPDSELTVHLYAAGHLPGAERVRIGSEVVDVVMSRAGQLVARLAEPALTERCKVQLVVTAAHLPQPHVVTFERDGTCRVPVLVVGSYRTALLLSSKEGRKGVVPLLAALEQVGERVVDVRVGQPTTVAFPTPPLGRVRGVVRARGEALGGVTVFALREGALAAQFDDPRAAETLPQTKTDPEGRFEFDVASSGALRLYALWPDAQVPAGPYPLKVVLERQNELDLDLPTSSVRGWFDLPNVPDRLRHGLHAHLVRRELASESFLAVPSGEWRFPGAPRCRLNAKGEFDFAWLPAGQWMVRIVDARGGVWAQEPVRTDGKGEPPWVRLPRVPVQDVAVRVEIGELPGPPLRFSAVARRVGGDGEPAAYWGKHEVAGGVLTLAHVPAGRYRLDFVQTVDRAAFPGVGADEERVLAERTLQVHADGSTTPARLR